MTEGTISIVSGYQPGTIRKVTRLHGDYYHRAWSFDFMFDTRLAADLSDFLGRFDDARDGFWLAMERDEVVGCIAIDGAKADRDGAQLRWFIVSSGCQGKGVGRKLLDTSLAFCDRTGYRKVFLKSFAGLDAARHLYERAGFRLDSEYDSTWYGVAVREQMFVRERQSAGSSPAATRP